jgi:hypothetical protein
MAEMNISEFGKLYGRRKIDPTGMDASLTISKNGDKEQAVIILRNDKGKLFKSGRAKVGTFIDYLCLIDSDEGSKLTLLGNSYYIKISDADLIEWVKKRKGGYNLTYYAKSNMHYIFAEPQVF